MRNQKMILLRHQLEQSERALRLFNELFPVIRMGSVEWDHHNKLMTEVAQAEAKLKQAEKEEAK